MKQLIENFKPTTASLIALLWTVAGILYLFYMASGMAKAHDTIQTQCLQGLFGIVMLIAGYYFGSSKHRSEPTQQPPLPTITEEKQEILITNNP